MIALVSTLALALCRANPSRTRWMPRLTPYAAHEIAMVSSTPAGSGLPIGLMPGALPSDHASRQTLNTTAMRFFIGHDQFGFFIVATLLPRGPAHIPAKGTPVGRKGYAPKSK